MKMSEPVRTPGAVGVKMTQTSQPKPWDKLLPQKLVRLKSPVVVMLLSDREGEPTFLILNMVACVEVPTACEP